MENLKGGVVVPQDRKLEFEEPTDFVFARDLHVGMQKH